MRPVLKPAVRRLWRDESTLQLGLDPERALVLAGVTSTAAAVLDRLDGTRRWEQVVAGDCASPTAAGSPSGRAAADSSSLPAPPEPDPLAERVLRILSAGGVLDDAGSDTSALAALSPPERERLGPDLASLSLQRPTPGAALDALRRRRAARVRVLGAGRVGAATAALLAAAGVGWLDVEDDLLARHQDVAPGGLGMRDVGRPRGPAVLSGLTGAEAGDSRAAVPLRRPGGARHHRDGDALDLVVLTPPGPPVCDPLQAASLEQAGIPHLLAGVRETTGIVGPLVLPGRTSCLRCQHLQRTARDPAWPVLAAQLRGPSATADDPCDVALSAVVAGLTALQALAVLDGDTPAAAGGTLELGLQDLRLRRRSWGVHPACGCATARAAAGDDAGW